MKPKDAFERFAGVALVIHDEHTDIAQLHSRRHEGLIGLPQRDRRLGEAWQQDLEVACLIWRGRERAVLDRDELTREDHAGVETTARDHRRVRLVRGAENKRSEERRVGKESRAGWVAQR